MSSIPPVFAARKPNQHMATASAFGLLEQEPCPALEWDLTSRVRDQTLLVCVVLLQAWSAMTFLLNQEKEKNKTRKISSLSVGEEFVDI